MIDIKELRQRTGMSQVKFADVLGVSVASLRRWEKGETSPSNMALDKIQQVKDAIDNNSLDSYLKSRQNNSVRQDTSDTSHNKENMTRTFKYDGKTHIVEYMPYVYNGPEDQKEFYDQLIDMQQHDDDPENWQSYQNKLSIVKRTDIGYTSGYSLERPTNKAKSWSGMAGAHGWHRYVGRFPAQVVRAIINKFQLTDHDVLLDPFCGSGTTLVEARLLGVPAIGIEISPLSAMITYVKSKFDTNTESLMKQIYDLESFYTKKWDDFTHQRKFSDITFEEIINRKGNEIAPFSNYQRWFTKEALLGTSITVEYLKKLGTDSYESKFIATALSSKMRSIGNVDVDVVRAEYRKTPRENVDVLKLVVSQMKKMINSIGLMNSSHKSTICTADKVNVLCDDCLKANIEKGSISAIITSPPYGVESLSYLRTHLLSFRALEPVLGVDPYNFNEGVIGSEYLNKNDELTTVEKISPTFYTFFSEMLKKSENENQLDRIYGMMKFFHDMDKLSEKFVEWLAPNGKIAFVIGNKKIGDDIIPTDTIITEIFRNHGLNYKGKIAHKLKTNNSNSQVPWQDRIIENEFIIFYEKGEL